MHLLLSKNAQDIIINSSCNVEDLKVGIGRYTSLQHVLYAYVTYPRHVLMGQPKADMVAVYEACSRQYSTALLAVRKRVCRVKQDYG